jgi:glycerol-1-phosphate dehydrogenase [NAD(P)+]
MMINEQALAGLTARVGDASALVVMDLRTRRAAGEAVMRALPGAHACVFERADGLLATPEAAAVVRGRADGAATIVAVGSGTITDIVRYAAHEIGCGFLSVPTAASMDGYASSVAAMQVGGVKVTTPARAPEGIYADPRIVAAAPPALTRAGIGDLLAKASARVDWLAAHLIYGESYDTGISAAVLALVERTCADVEALLGGDPQAARALLGGLIESGLAIAAVGNSRPASGCEHHASHFWDLLAARGRRPHELHGLQVGYATHFAMRLQRFAYGGGLTGLRRPQPAADPLGPDARAWLGEPTGDLLAAVEEKRRFTAAVPANWPATEEAWRGIRTALAEALSVFPRVAQALEAAGIPGEPGFLGIDAELLRATFRHATRLRGRYTVIDLLEGQRRLDDGLRTAIDA